MTHQIDQFVEALHLEPVNIESRLGDLRAKVDGKARQAERNARVRLGVAERRLEQSSIASGA